MYLREFLRRSRYLILSVALLFALKPTFSVAGEEDPTYISILKYPAGIVAGFLVHESAHALVAGMTGTDMSWKVGTYNQPFGFTENADRDWKGLALNSAGLISQAIGSEIILQSDRIDKNDAFVRGMMAWNILNPIFYALDYWLLRVSNRENHFTRQGDLEGIEHYSNETVANTFALSMAAIATYQGYRFLKTQSWAPDWLRGESPRVGLMPLYSGGFMMTIKFDF